MPLYEYRCDRCGKTFEIIQKFSDDPLTVHEGCGGQVERLPSPPALQFKGTGWYITDYGKNHVSPAARHTAESRNSGKTESKSETKAAPATAPAPAKS